MHNIGVVAVGGVLVGLSLIELSACSNEHQPSAAMPSQSSQEASPADVGPRDEVATDAAVGGSEPPPPAAGAQSAQGHPPDAATEPVATRPDAATEPDAARPDAAADQPSEWRSIGYDVASTYFNRVETKLTKQNVGQLKLAWMVDLGASIYSAPLQIADRIYVSGPNDVRAFDAASGDELWRLEVKSSSTLSFNDGVLYLNTHELYVVAIEAATGTEMWRRRADMQITDGYSSVVAVDGRLLVGAAGSNAELSGGKFRGYMAALDLKSGDALWTSYTVPETANGAGIFSSPSADVAARLAFGTTSNNYGPPATDTSDAFIAFDLDTGAIQWKYQAVANDTFDLQREDGATTQDLNFGANPVLYETEDRG